MKLEKGRMVLVELGEDMLHGGFADKGGAGVDAELAAILVNGRNFLFVKEYGFTESSLKCGSFLVVVAGVYACLLFSHTSQI